jgi:thymidylate synthase (FAD)
MEVRIVDYTKDSMNKIANIARVCTGRSGKKTTDSKDRKTIINLLKKEHYSPFEHAYATFEVKGVSRALLAQLSRHRHLSLMVKSQRYVREFGSSYVAPVKNISEDAMDLFKDAMQNSFEVYQKLIDEHKWKPEDARLVLPQSVSTHLFITGNYRALMEFFEKRNSQDAQLEIRKMSLDMMHGLATVDDTWQLIRDICL